MHASTNGPRKLLPSGGSARGARVAAALALLLLASRVVAGGGVMLEGDRCVITIGFYEAHFTAYQPDSRGNEEFCEDLPDLGETLFVLDYLHGSLKEVPVDFRIIRNTTGLGRFARSEDVAALPDRDAQTVFYQPPEVKPDATYRVAHVFDQPGEYIGVVTAGHPSNGKTYTAVFPFSVGAAGIPGGWIGLAAAAVVACVGVWLLRRRLRGRAHPADRAGVSA